MIQQFRTFLEARQSIDLLPGEVYEKALADAVKIHQQLEDALQTKFRYAVCLNHCDQEQDKWKLVYELTDGQVPGFFPGFTWCFKFIVDLEQKDGHVNFQGFLMHRSSAKMNIILYDSWRVGPDINLIEVWEGFTRLFKEYKITNLFKGNDYAEFIKFEVNFLVELIKAKDHFSHKVHSEISFYSDEQRNTLLKTLKKKGLSENEIHHLTPPSALDNEETSLPVDYE